MYSEGSPHELHTDPGVAKETRKWPIRLQAEDEGRSDAGSQVFPSYFHLE